MLNAGISPASPTFDNHPIKDRYIRTFLNYRGEYKVGSTYIIYVDAERYIEIQNDDAAALEQYRQGDPNWQLSTNVIVHGSDDVQQVNCANFTYQRVTSGTPMPPRRYQFTPQGLVTTSTLQVIWTWGDGSRTVRSGAQAVLPVDHDFLREGDFLVQMEVRDFAAGCAGSKSQVVRTPNAICASTIPANAAQFTVTRHQQNQVTVGVSNPVSGWTYTFDFGDGNYQSRNNVVSGFSSFANSFPAGDNAPAQWIYSITLWVSNNQGCLVSYSQPITINKPDCTVFLYKSDPAPWEFDNGNRLIKYQVFASAIFPSYRLGAETESYKKRNGRWRDERVDRIFAQVKGKYMDTQCYQQEIYNGGHSERNDNEAQTHYSVRTDYKLDTEIAFSEHFIDYSGIRWNPRTGPGTTGRVTKIKKP